MNHVLVTGGAGFIGSHLVDRLVSEAHEVTIIDSLEAQVHPRLPEYLNRGAKYLFSRVNARTLNYRELLRNVDTVYYLASKVGPNQSMSAIEDYIECNINNLGYFLQQILEHGASVKRLIFSGSMGPYGEGKYRCHRCSADFYPREVRRCLDFTCPQCKGAVSNLPLDETTEIQAGSYYGVTKQVQEQMLTLFARTFDRELVSLRYFSVYGARQAFSNPYAGPIPIWINHGLQGKDLVVYEDGQQTRDFINVGDLTNLNYLAGCVDLPSNVEIVNCGTGISTQIVDVARHIQEHLRSPSRLRITGGIRSGDLRHSLCDNRKLKSLFGYERFIPVMEGLRAYVQSLCPAAILP